MELVTYESNLQTTKTSKNCKGKTIILTSITLVSFSKLLNFKLNSCSDQRLVSKQFNTLSIIFLPSIVQRLNIMKLPSVHSRICKCVHKPTDQRAGNFEMLKLSDSLGRWESCDQHSCTYSCVIEPSLVIIDQMYRRTAFDSTGNIMSASR